MCFFLILSCKKDYVTKFDDLKEDIKLAEIHNWELQLKQQIQAPSEFLIHKAQRFFDKGKLVVRVPIKNSNGYFFFMKEENKLQGLYVEAFENPVNRSMGQVRIIDFEKRFVNIITYKNNKKDSLYSLKDKAIFNKLFTSNGSVEKKIAGQGCPETITSFPISDHLSVKADSDGSIKCPTTDKPRTLGEILGSIFDKAFGWIPPFFQSLFGSSTSSYDWSNYIDPYGNLINADVMLYWHLTNMDMNSIINLYMDGSSSVWSNYDFNTIADVEYGLTVGDLQILDEVNAEFDATDYATNNPSPCKGTMRIGSVKFQGTLEHWIIQYDYINQNLGSYREYMIPGAGSTPYHPGFADLVNESTMEIFEIKPDNIAGYNAGLNEVNHYINKANIVCNKGTFRLGFNYTRRLFSNPRDPSSLLESRLFQNGVIVYKSIPKNSEPSFVALPESMVNRIRSFIRSLAQNSSDIDKKIIEFLKRPENHDILRIAKGGLYGISIGIIVATITEDFLTWGAGIWNDWQSFVLAAKIIQLARKMPYRSTLVTY